MEALNLTVTAVVADDEARLLTLASSLEKKSEHPLARAIMEYAMEHGVHVAEVRDFAALPGNGVTAILDDHTLTGGSGKFIGDRLNVPINLIKKAESFAESGKTPLFFGMDNRLLGIIAVADVIKEDSSEAVRQLKKMGIRVVMLTGDNERTAKAIGKQAGVDEVIAGVLPDGKESVIRALQEQGKVAMVGD